MFTVCEILRDVFGNLAGDQRCLSRIRFFQTDVLDDEQSAVCADCAGDIELALRIQRQLHNGLLHVGFDISEIIRDCQQHTRRAAAVDAHRDRIARILECIPDERCRH